ncbi:hypothetical protein IQ230_16670 [Gloeocapsopsis crepidinum LEGE 06123]|uniref:Nuclear transport factor 2 family protein n=1 Tax=Gloeocapsopsis crepidinum LEGE 06123 TaxID=588587 RepID=A0ABR9UUG9_9CHRO|nr:hypothetical protein [Gloeocapsopsis crepidinum]MBE9191956.1 hypothetical protein [Gloeocapsopsis crepidinum LEGE 06123]
MIAVRRLQISICTYLLAYSFSLELTKTKPAHSTYLQQSVGFVQRSPQCQTEDVEILTSQLLPALPGYANRVSQRTRRRDAIVDIYTYVLIAGRPEFIPLTLGPGEYTPDMETVTAQQPQQVFITTLERQYIDGKPVELQQFHWLFFTRAEGGWRLAMMFSRTGSYPSQRPVTPPRNSSNGIIAQAIRTWLRDCQTNL